MSLDDPRHGTNAGHVAGCRDLCCRRAKLRYDKRRRAEQLSTGARRVVPPWRVARRIEALQALGWSLRSIASEAGVPHNHLSEQRTRAFIFLKTFEKIDGAYQRLSMRLPEERTMGQRSGVVRTRNHARRNAYAPPLCWDDIDDPDAAPDYGGTDSDIDPVVVMRLLEGQRVQSTRAEKVAALERWVMDGGSEREMCSWHGWNEGRYSAGLRLVRGGAA